MVRLYLIKYLCLRCRKYTLFYYLETRNVSDEGVSPSRCVKTRDGQVRVPQRVTEATFAKDQSLTIKGEVPIIRWDIR